MPHDVLAPICLLYFTNEHAVHSSVSDIVLLLRIGHPTRLVGLKQIVNLLQLHNDVKGYLAVSKDSIQLAVVS